MPKFSEIPKFILLDFFSMFMSSPFYDGSVTFLRGPRATVTGSPFADFYGIIELADSTDNLTFYEVKFKPKGYSQEEYYDGGNLFFLERTGAENIDITEECNFYILRKKGGNVQTYFYSILENGIEFNNIDVDYFINPAKHRQYVGVLYPKDDYYVLEYHGIDRYATTCLPEHNQTEKLKEFFYIFFDQVYTAVYNQQRNVKTLLDPKEVALDFLPEIPKFFNLGLHKSFYESLFDDTLSTATKIKDRRTREFVFNLINLLKRTGTYSSLYAIFKSLFNPTNDNLNVYERWHVPEVMNYTGSFDLEPHLIDINYEEYYNTTITGCASASGYYSTLNYNGILIPAEGSYIHSQTAASTKWFVFHSLECNAPIVQILDSTLTKIIPSGVNTITPNLTIIDFSSAIKGYALLTKPEVISTFAGSRSAWSFLHNLDTIVPIAESLYPTTYTYNTTTFSSSASVLLSVVAPSGTNRLLEENITNITDLISVAIEGDYVYSTVTPSANWSIEHNLDSKAILIDCYAAIPSSAWYITHNFDTRDLIVVPYNSNHEAINYLTLYFQDTDLFKLSFSDVQTGFVRLITDGDAIALASNTRWTVTHSVSALYPIVQIHNAANYNVPYSAIDVMPYSTTTIALSANTTMSGTAILAAPDYIHTQTIKHDYWNIKHNLDSTDLVATVYVAVEVKSTTIANPFNSTNIIVQCYNDNRIKVHPTTVTISASAIYIVFAAEFKGFIVLDAADDTVTANASAFYHVYHDIAPALDYNIISQMHETINTSGVYTYNANDLNQLNADSLIFYNENTPSAQNKAFQIIRGHFVDYNAELNASWYVEHHLDSFDLLTSFYTPLFTTATSAEHNYGYAVTQIYNYWGVQQRPETIKQETNHTIYAQVDTAAVSGYYIYPVEAYSFSHASSASWTIYHNLNSRNLIVQIYDGITGMLVHPLNVTLADNNTANVTLSAATSGQFVVTTAAYSETTTITESPYVVEHNLNTPGIVISMFNSAYEEYIPSSVTILDSNTCTISLSSTPIADMHINVTGAYPLLYENEPTEVFLYNKNWLKLSFDKNTIGYTILKRTDESCMPCKIVQPSSISFVSDDEIRIDFDSDTIGYASLAITDYYAMQVQKEEPDSINLESENIATAEWSSEKIGYAAVKEIGQIPYGANLVSSPHYKAEIDINCETLCGDDILTEDYAEFLMTYWKLVKPVSKYAHYFILIAPSATFTGATTRLYNNPSTSADIYTYCCRESDYTSTGYVYSQILFDDTWNITHNLNTENVIVQCYDNTFNLVYASSVQIIDSNNIQVRFYTPFRGICLILTAEDNITNTLEASAFWEYDAHMTGISDSYFYFDKKQILPSNMQIVPVSDIEETWYVPTLGYCRIRDDDYLHAQLTQSTTWTVTHNLSYYGVIVKVYDGNRNEILPSNIQLDSNSPTVTIDFGTTPVSGYAYLSSVGNLYTQENIIDSLKAGGYIKVGQGTNTDTYDPLLTNDLKDPLETDYRYNVVVIEDDNYYYVKGDFIGNRDISNVTEFGLFNANDDIIFYSYVKDGDFYKAVEFDYTILYALDKPITIPHLYDDTWRGDEAGVDVAEEEPAPEEPTPEPEPEEPACNETWPQSANKFYLSNCPKPDGFIGYREWECIEYGPNDDTCEHIIDGGYWYQDNATDANIYMLSTEKIGSAFQTQTSTETLDASNSRVFRSYISPPLTAGQVLNSGSFKLQLRAAESNAAANAMLYVNIEVWFYNDPYWILIDYFYTGESLPLSNEFATTLTNRSLTGSLEDGGTWTTVGGERLVVYIGYKAFANTGTYDFSFEFGDDSANDLPEDNSSTDQFCPWIEFSNTLYFEEPPGGYS